VIAAITLDTGGDTVPILLWSILAGASASAISELLLARGKTAQTGAFELPGKTGKRLYDLGSFAAIPIGALAGAIAGLALTPVQEVTADNVTTRTMELDKLLVVALVAGLASSAFLRVLSDRFVAAMKTQGLDVALRDAISALKDVATSVPQPEIASSQSAAAAAARADQAAKAADATLKTLTGSSTDDTG
jgi:hypothetical protein